MDGQVWIISRYGRNDDGEVAAVIGTHLLYCGYRVRIWSLDEKHARIRPSVDKCVAPWFSLERQWGRIDLDSLRGIVTVGEDGRFGAVLMRGDVPDVPIFGVVSRSDGRFGQEDCQLFRKLFAVSRVAADSCGCRSNSVFAPAYPEWVGPSTALGPACVVVPLAYGDLSHWEMTGLCVLERFLCEFDAELAVVINRTRLAQYAWRRLQELFRNFGGRVRLIKDWWLDSRFARFPRGSVLFWPRTYDPYLTVPYEALLTGLRVVCFNLPEVSDLTSASRGVYAASCDCRREGAVVPDYESLYESLVQAWTDCQSGKRLKYPKLPASLAGRLTTSLYPVLQEAI